MQISARNQLQGTVKKITEGPINDEVVLEIAPGVEITAVITKNAAKSLGLYEGSEAVALVKASNVMLGVE